MKRSAALAPLSRDHQHALEAARRLRRAADADRPAAVAHFLDFWESEGRNHFAIEERLLLPALGDDVPGWAGACARVRAEHDEIRGLAGAIGESPTDRLGELLHDHVRFEERTLFPMLERELPEAELVRLGAAIEAAER